jgi:hypothetical protein
MFSFYSSVCNLLTLKSKIYSKNEMPPSVRLCDYDYVIAKNESNETIVLEVKKQPKLYNTWKNNKK